MANSKISQIKLPNGQIYDINALYFNGMTEAELIAKISPIIQSDSVQYLGLIGSINGLSTTASKGDFYRASVAFDIAHAGDLIIALVDNPIQDLTEDFTVEAGWAVVHGGEFDTTHVHDIAHTHSDNDLVFEDANIQVSGTANGNVTISVGTGPVNYTPAGTVEPSYTSTASDGASGSGIDLAHTHTYDKATSATISVTSGAANYTPEGTVSVTTTTDVSEANVEAGISVVTGITEGSASLTSVTTQGSNDIPYIAEQGSFTEGTLPTLTISTKNVSNITAWNAGSPMTAVAEGEVLVLTAGVAPSLTHGEVSIGSASGWSAGRMPTLGNATTKYLHYSYTSASAAGTGTAAPNGHKHNYVKATGAGSFTGTGKQLVVTLDHTSTNTGSSLTGTAAVQAHTHNYDKVTSASFSGTGVELKAIFTGNSNTSTGTYQKLKSASFSGKSGQPE